MNKTKTRIKHQTDGSWYFESSVHCSYEPKKKLKVTSATFPKATAEELLQRLEEEERRLTGIVQELDKDYIQTQHGIMLHDIQSMLDYIQKAIKCSRNYVQYGTLKYKVEDLESARVTLGALNVIFNHPPALPAVSAIVPHLLRQRMFEILSQKQVLSAHRIFDVVYAGNAGIAI